MVRIANPRYATDQSIVSNVKFTAERITPDIVYGRMLVFKQKNQKKPTDTNKPQLYAGEAMDAFIGVVAKDVYDGFLTIHDSLVGAFDNVIQGGSQGGFVSNYNTWVNNWQQGG